MAVMYTANHMRVRAIVALTESGMTPLWMSRIRSDMPIYAFTRHEATRRRVTLYRGVYPVPFDITSTETTRDLQLDLRAAAGIGPGGHQRPGDPDQGRAVGRVRGHQLHADPARGQPPLGDTERQRDFGTGAIHPGSAMLSSMAAEPLQGSRAPIGPTVGLVLPGGGARAAYQVGVLKAIAEMLPPDAPQSVSGHRRHLGRSRGGHGPRRRGLSLAACGGSAGKGLGQFSRLAGVPGRPRRACCARVCTGCCHCCRAASCCRRRNRCSTTPRCGDCWRAISTGATCSAASIGATCARWRSAPPATTRPPRWRSSRAPRTSRRGCGSSASASAARLGLDHRDGEPRRAVPVSAGAPRR